MLDFRVQTFLTVCHYMNFTKAAAELCITQPAVSQHIKYLENEYQTKFFNYEGKKLSLTSHGKLFYETLATIQQDERFLKQKMSQQTTQQPHLKFGATLTIGEFILPAKLARLLQRQPATQITMIVENTADLLQKLTRGEIDFAFLEGHFPKKDYDFVPYAREKYLCVAGRDYPLQKPVRLLEDLIAETIIVREKGSGTRDIFEKNLANQDLLLTDCQQLIEIGNINTIKKLVQANLGITAIYEIAVTEELQQESLQVLPIEDLQKFHDLYIVWRKNSTFGNYYRELAESIR